MISLIDFGRRLRRVLNWRRAEAEMDEELRFHLEMEEAHNSRNGLSSDVARRRARLTFGGIDGHREAIRDARGLPAAEDLWRDVRFGVRQLRRRAGSTVTLVLVLALGIGVNVGGFTYFNSAMNAPPKGVAKNDRLVRIRGAETFEDSGRLDIRGFSLEEIEGYRGQGAIFEDVAALTSETVVVELPGDTPEIVAGTATFVSSNYFDILGVSVGRGSALPADASDPADLSVAIISDGLWRSSFGSDPDLTGKLLRVNGQAISIIGVLPPGFESIDFVNNDVAVYMLLDARDLVTPPRILESRETPVDLQAIALLRPGVSREAATSAARVVAARTPPPEGRSGVSSDVAPLLPNNLGPNYESAFARETAAMGALTILILLVTCTNVSSLLVGMATQRGREIAVRISLGATRRRLLRQLITESALISLAAGALACVIVWLLVTTLGNRVDDVPLVFDRQVVLFGGFFALAVGMLFGLSPALHATRVGAAEVLKSSTGSVAGSRSWLQRGLVVAQVALTQPLLVAIVGLVFAARAELQSEAFGGIGTRIASITFNPVSFDPEGLSAIPRIKERLEGMPGVAAVAQEFPYTPRSRLHLPATLGSGGRPTTVTMYTKAVDDGFFDVMGARLREGRFLTEQDTMGSAEMVVIGEQLATRLFGTSSALGRTLQVDGYGQDLQDLTVVGVVDDRTLGTGSDEAPTVYVPMAGLGMTLLVRTEGPAEPMLPTMRAIISAEAPHLPVREATTLAIQEAETRALMLKIGGAVSVGGALALGLSAIGLYGIISLAVTARRREIGIRTAIGASSGGVVGLFFRSGIGLCATGLVIGLPLSLFWFRRFAQAELIPYSGTPQFVVIISLAVLGVAALASWIPARRAAGQDPLAALRSQ